MSRVLTVRHEAWPIRGGFRISRDEKTKADVVVAEISNGRKKGRGECTPYPHYGQDVAGEIASIEGLAAEVADGMTRAALQERLPAGPARNALDCALLDLEAKERRVPAYAILKLPKPRPMRTAFTLSLDAPDAMAQAARAAWAKGYRLLKLKIAGEGDLPRVEAVHKAAPGARLIADANEGFAFADLAALIPALHRLGVGLVEQPLPADEDEALAGFDSPVPLCADESCHTRADLSRVKERYACINIKLDKTGGLTEAVALARAAKEMGLMIMVGCMVSTSLSMAPASLLGPLADFVDLDGPLLLARDREPGLRYHADVLDPPPSALWG